MSTNKQAIRWDATDAYTRVAVVNGVIIMLSRLQYPGWRIHMRKTGDVYRPWLLYSDDAGKLDDAKVTALAYANTRGIAGLRMIMVRRLGDKVRAVVGSPADDKSAPTIAYAKESLFQALPSDAVRQIADDGKAAAAAQTGWLTADAERAIDLGEKAAAELKARGDMHHYPPQSVSFSLAYGQDGYLHGAFEPESVPGACASIPVASFQLDGPVSAATHGALVELATAASEALSASRAYRAEIDDDGLHGQIITCDDCGNAAPFEALDAIGDCMLTPGDPSPCGRCSECAALVYPAISARRQLQPDPEGRNDSRAEWAKSALMHFAGETGCDYETESRYDLMTNLIHLADREGWDFDDLVAGARENHRIETGKDS